MGFDMGEEKKKKKESNTPETDHQITEADHPLAMLMLVGGTIVAFYGLMKIFLEFSSGAEELSFEMLVGLIFGVMGLTLLLIGYKYKLSHKTKTRKNLEKAIIACPVLLFGFFGTMMAMSPEIPKLSSTKTPAKENSKKPEDYAITAFVQCQDHVLDRLKSPSSAEFPLLDFQAAYAEKTSTFIISSYVDAQNSFGAKLRTNWTCKIEKNGKNWTLQGLHLAGR